MQSRNDSTTDALIDATLAGSDSAYEELWEGRLESVFKALYDRRFRNVPSHKRPELEDVRQDSMMSTRRSLPTYDRTRAKIETWYRRIHERRTSDAMKAMRRHTREAHDETLRAKAERMVECYNLAPIEDQEEALWLTDLARKILNPDTHYARALFAVHGRGMSREQAAVELNRSRHALRADLKYAYRLIRDHILTCRGRFSRN